MYTQRQSFELTQNPSAWSITWLLRQQSIFSADQSFLLHFKIVAFYSKDTIGPFIRGKVKRVLHKTRTGPFILACLIWPAYYIPQSIIPECLSLTQGLGNSVEDIKTFYSTYLKQRRIQGVGGRVQGVRPTSPPPTQMTAGSSNTTGILQNMPICMINAVDVHRWIQEATRGQGAFASPLVCLSRVYFSRYPPNGEVARRLQLARPCVCWNLKLIRT